MPELTPGRRELLRLLRGGARDAGPAAPIPRGRVGDSSHPLSSAQRRYWFLDQLDPGNPSAHLGCCYRLRGPLDLAALRSAVAAIVARHESLRTTFPVAGAEPVAVIGAGPEPDVEVVELAGGDLDERVASALTEPFDLETGPLLRLRLVRVAPQDHVLVIVAHHVIADGWSMDLIRRELGVRYGGGPAGLPDPVQYQDYAQWQRTRLDLPTTRHRHLLYWKSRLRGAPPALDLPADRARPPGPPRHGATRDFAWPAGFVQRVKEFAALEGVTPNMALLATFAVLLYRYTGQRDLVIGMPFANRDTAGLESVVGPVSNTMPVRIELAARSTVREVLAQVKRAVLDAFAHAELPFDLLVADLGLRPDPDRNPLFQVMFQVQSLAGGGGLALAGLRVERFVGRPDSSALDLDLLLAERGGELSGELTYNTDVLDCATVDRMVSAYQALTADACARPAAGIDRLDVRPDPPADGDLLAAADPGEDVVELVAGQVAGAPDRIAVSSPDGQLSYRALWLAATRLAAALRATGVRPGAPVGLALDRGAGLPVAVLGTWLAGAAFLPLDPAFPEPRLRDAVEDSGAAVVVTGGDRRGLVAGWPVRPVCLDDLAGRPAGSGPPLTAGRLAYLMYTSGSTGRPKGIAVPHSALATFVASMRRAPGLDAGDVLLAVTTLSFDISLLELVAPLSVGARVVVAGRDDTVDGRRIAELLDRHGVTVMQATPATWRLLLDAGWRGRPGLRVLAGGEALPAALAERLRAGVAQVWNLYGPTECTIWATAHRLCGDDTAAGTVPIGHPIANTRTFVADDGGEPTLRGTRGELTIGGTGVAWGYWNRPGLTAERFVPDPFGPPGARAYRSGDVVRTGAGGALSFLGRRDHQVKLRGFRIELGEVETAIAAHPAVAGCMAAVLDDRMIAYLVPAPVAAPPGVPELRAFAGRRLPHYMLPDAAVVLDAIPLTPNGKVDRAALPAPPAAVPAGHPPAMPPRAGRERRVAAIWADVLGVASVAPHDNFLDLGGNSLRLAALRNRLEEELDRRIDIVDLFRYPTVAAFLAHLDRAAEGSDPDNHPRRERRRRDRVRARLAAERERRVSGDELA